MLIIRSIIFNMTFFFAITTMLFLGAPLVLIEEKYVYIFWKYVSIVLGYITTKIGGISFVVENEENLLKQPAIYAVRHESTWETLILIQKFEEPIFIIKKELLDVPLFGRLSRKSGAISVDRDNGVKALIDATRRVEKSINDGHPVIMFPEGTRVRAGKHVPMKRGIALFYKKTNCPVVPVIHNSGTFWPRHGFVKKPGTITLKFLDPIPPGLSQGEFMKKLNNVFSCEIEKMRLRKG
jgi:1-acyl-sn-glycerol-3-phosphate acyltransferase